MGGAAVDGHGVAGPAPGGLEVAALAGGTALLAWSLATHGVVASVVAGADLLFHEAGHAVLGILGLRFLTLLGGTLGQLAFPVGAGLAFAARRQLCSAAAMAAWLGVNLVDVGTYAADAEARVLPLLAASPDSHDWWQMLGMLGIRAHASGIGGTIQALGWALVGAAPAVPCALWLARRAVGHEGAAERPTG